MAVQSANDEALGRAEMDHFFSPWLSQPQGPSAFHGPSMAFPGQRLAPSTCSARSLRGHQIFRCALAWHCGSISWGDTWLDTWWWLVMYIERYWKYGWQYRPCAYDCACWILKLQRDSHLYHLSHCGLVAGGSSAARRFWFLLPFVASSAMWMPCTVWMFHRRPIAPSRICRSAQFQTSGALWSHCAILWICGRNP